MLTPERIFSIAKDYDGRIGIGSIHGSQKVEKSVRIAEENGYGKNIIFYDAKELVDALFEGRIDAAVRGDLDSNMVMKAIKIRFGLDHIIRLALIQPIGGTIFFLAPVGIDEGWTIDEKLEIVRSSVELLRRMDEESAIGIMSGGRSSDLGRCKVVDQTINDAEEVVRRLRSEGLDAENVQILIEEAVGSKNLIIAPDGISGNLIFRCLHLVDGGRSMGAPILNIDKVFIDTSRAKPNYLDSIALAGALACRNVSGPKGNHANIKR
jgi:putative methanogen marker protein 4